MPLQSLGANELFFLDLFVSGHISEQVLGIQFLVGLYDCVGYKVIRRQGKNDGAKWYGKLSTLIFYVVTVVLVLFADINVSVANVLLGVSAVAILGAFVGYISQHVKILRKKGLK